jgi:hypothetical protein
MTPSRLELIHNAAQRCGCHASTSKSISRFDQQLAPKRVAQNLTAACLCLSSDVCERAFAASRANAGTKVRGVEKDL